MLSTEPRITLILPAYNEVQQIGRTLDEVEAYFRRRSFAYEVIVAADGDDGTREVAERRSETDPRVRVLGSVGRRGKGAALREAVALARGEIVGFMDADNKSSIDEYDKMEPWPNCDYDIVIGSRGLPESQIGRPQPFYRQVGSRAFGVLMHAVVGLPTIVDTQCGFKFFPRSVAQDLFARSTINGYMIDVEILAWAQKLGYRVAEVPIHWRDDGDSRLDLWRDSPRIVHDLLRIRLQTIAVESPPSGYSAESGKWPKQLPELTVEQQRIKDDFFTVWLKVLPKRFGLLERFNHGYPLRTHAPAVVRTLEIGAGLGEHARFENARPGEYWAVELRGGLARAIARTHPHTRVVIANCQGHLPFPDESFDRLLAIHVLEHLPNLPQALAEARRVLRPNGVLSAVIPCEGGLLYTLGRNFSARPLFERRYGQSYDWFIASEHINRPAEILEELNRYFIIRHRRDFPLRLPLVDLNLVIGLTARPRVN